MHAGKIARGQAQNNTTFILSACILVSPLLVFLPLFARPLVRLALWLSRGRRRVPTPSHQHQQTTHREVVVCFFFCLIVVCAERAVQAIEPNWPLTSE